ncbi:MAG: methyltransferase domain-containing protein [Candidatus Heimdallarchaeota archaeon]|nr:methyltransferase domain-containing protein [Candidatus Heimdallarchaeota archaeon]
MKKQTPVIQKSTKSQFAWRRLGFLQLSLIMHLRQKEMYGVEIREHLALDGYVVDDNQIYPALKGLLNSGFIEISDHKGKKKHYQTTEEGRKVVAEYLFQFYGLFNERIQEKLLFVRDEILEYLTVRSGMIFADFSVRFSEIQLKPIITIGNELGPIGRMIIHNLHPKFYEITQKRIKMMRGQEYLSVINPEIKNEESETNKSKVKSPLPDDSVDFALSIFTLHLSGMDWIIPEISRILKPGGKAVIASSFDETEVDVRYAFVSVYFDMIEELYPFVNKLGVSKGIVEDQLKENGLQIVKQKEGNGAYYFLISKPTS